MGDGRVIPDGYRLERGLLWPASDVGAAAVMFSGVADLDVAYKHCSKFDVAIQAGGNCGVWPKAMGEKFELVYTFEPDPMNFRCLCANAPAENIYKFNAALGPDNRRVGMLRRPGLIKGMPRSARHCCRSISDIASLIAFAAMLFWRRDTAAVASEHLQRSRQSGR